MQTLKWFFNWVGEFWPIGRVSLLQKMQDLNTTLLFFFLWMLFCAMEWLKKKKKKREILGEKDVILKKITTTDTKIYKRDKKMNL